MPDISYRVKAEDDTGPGLSAAHRDLDTLSEKSEHASEATGGLEGALGKLGVAAAGVGAVMGAKEFLGDSVGAAENLAQSVSKLQRTMGGTPEDASRMKFAIDEAVGSVGGNTDAAEKSMGRFAKTLAGLGDPQQQAAQSNLDSVTKNIEKLGISVTDADGNMRPMADIQADLTAKLSGTAGGAKTVSTEMDKLSQAVTALGGDPTQIVVHGNQQLIDTFQHLGIQTQDAAGKALPVKDMLGQLADKFKEMPDGAEKTALAMQLFGRQGADLIPFLNKGSEGVADLMKESDKLGLTLSGNTIQQTQKLAAAQRTFGEAMEGVKVQIGVALLPVLTALAEGAAKLATFIASNVVPAIQQFAAWLGPQLTPIISQVQATLAQIVPQVVAFAEQLGQKLVPVIQTVVQWLTQHKEVLALVAITIGTLVAGPIAAFIAAIVLVKQHWTEIQPVVQRFIEYVQNTVIPAIQHWINDVFMPRFEELKKYITVEFLPKFQAALTNIKDIVTEVVQWVVDHWQQIHAVIQPVIDVVLPQLMAQFKIAKDVVETVMSAIKDIISIVLDVISGNWKGAWNDIQKLVDDIWKGISSVIGDALTGIEGTLAAAWTLIQGAAQKAWDGLQLAVALAWTAISQAVLNGIGDLEKLIEALPGQITGWLGDLAHLLFQAGADLIQGLIDGVTSKAKDLGDTIGGLAGKAKKAFTDPLSIFSPSKVMAGVGEDFVQGFIDGALGRTGALGDAVAKLAQTASSGFAQGFTGGDPASELARRLTSAPTGSSTPTAAPQTHPLLQAFAQGQAAPAPGSATGFGAPGLGGGPAAGAGPQIDWSKPGGVAVGIAGSATSGFVGAGRGLPGGAQSYGELVARWGLERNTAFAQYLDGTEAGAKRAVDAFMALGGGAPQSTGPNWGAPIPLPTAEQQAAASRGSPIHPATVAAGSAAPLGGQSITVFALDVNGLVRELDQHLKRMGQPGLAVR